MEPLEQSAFKDFAFVLSLVPELKGWSSDQKQALVEIIRAKVSADEADYLRLLQRHHALKEALVRLGSAPDGRPSPRQRLSSALIPCWP